MTLLLLLEPEADLMTDDQFAEDRLIAEQTLVDRCTITRPDGTATFDPATGTDTPDDPTTIWSGPCSAGDVTEQPATYGSMTATTYNRRIRVPMATPAFELGDIVTITDVHPGGNTRLIGQAASIVELPEKSTMILRRLHCVRGTQRRPVE